MLKVNQVLLVLTLFVAGSLGRSPPDVGDGFRPGTVQPSSNKCIKDLVLVIDTSDSIEKKNFENKVQPFLMDFVRHPDLNVNRDGTRIAMVRFSTRERTDITLKFNNLYNAEEIANKIGELKWADIRGDQTRTETGLGEVDVKIFPDHDPYNVRPEIQDVVVLVTDGRPTNFGNADKIAKVIKDKGILIVGAAIGPQRNEFMPQLEQLASGKEYVVKADFDKLNDVIGTIIAKSCVRPADCKCPKVGHAPYAVPLGQSKVEVNWKKPSPSCRNKASPNINGETVSPEGIISPHMFGVGEHTITYTFKLNGDVTVDCPVFVKVTGELCGSRAYNLGSHVCCCGEIHRKKTGNVCCGKFYYNPSSKTCCDQTRGNLVSATTGELCPA